MTDQDMLIEELNRELKWAKENIAQNKGGQEMRPKVERIESELLKLNNEKEK